MAIPMRRKVLAGVSAGSTTHTPVDMSGYELVSMVVVTSAGVSGGEVVLELSPDPAFAGTWVSLLNISLGTPNAVNKTGTSNGVTSLYARARINSAIIGGTVDVWIVGVG